MKHHTIVTPCVRRDTAGGRTRACDHITVMCSHGRRGNAVVNEAAGSDKVDSNLLEQDGELPLPPRHVPSGGGDIGRGDRGKVCIYVCILGGGTVKYFNGLQGLKSTPLP